MSARTELIALLECVVPLDTARDMVDRHHAEVAEDTKRAAAVQALGALPMPTGGTEGPCDGFTDEDDEAATVTGPSPWERAVAGLNALVDAGIAFWIEPDGHISGPFGDEHIEWDQDASRWRLVHDDEDDDDVPPSHPASVEDPHDGPLHSSYALPHDLPEILAHLSGGDLPADAVREKRCLLPPIGCGRALVDSVAVTATESAEYRITGLCPTCQDRIADVPVLPAQRDQWGQA